MKLFDENELPDLAAMDDPGAEQQELVTVESAVIPMDYSPVAAMIQEAIRQNENAVFVYEDPKGNKAARSHVASLRRVRAAIDRRRKELKDEALQYGRRVDAEAKRLTEIVNGMISTHETPLLAIENREKERVARIQERLYVLNAFRQVPADSRSAQIQVYLDQADAVAIDDSWMEFKLQAETAKNLAVEYLQGILQTAVKREADEAELERLRQEKEQRDREAREEEIRKEAEEKARREADEAAARRVENARIAQERAEKAAREAEERAERARQEERDRIQREQEQAEAEREARERDEAHREHVMDVICAALVEFCGGNAAALTEALAAGAIPHVRVEF